MVKSGISRNYGQLQFTLAVLLGLFITAAIFTTFPKIDLWIASLFAAANGGFPLWENPFLILLGAFYKVLFILISSIAAIMLLLNFRIRPNLKIPVQIWAFICTIFLLGPGLLVNVILKDNWGRARPAHIHNFGGSAQFTPPLLVTDECNHNCSFVSGEGSAIFSVMIVLVVLLWRAFPDRRRPLVVGATLLSVVGACLRIANGRHFLSDTLFAALFSALIILGLYSVFTIHKHRRAVSLRTLQHDYTSVCRYVLSVKVQPNLRLDVQAVWARLSHVMKRI